MALWALPATMILKEPIIIRANRNAQKFVQIIFVMFFILIFSLLVVMVFRYLNYGLGLY